MKFVKFDLECGIWHCWLRSAAFYSRDMVGFSYVRSYMHTEENIVGRTDVSDYPVKCSVCIEV